MSTITVPRSRWPDSSAIRFRRHIGFAIVAFALSLPLGFHYLPFHVSELLGVLFVVVCVSFGRLKWGIASFVWAVAVVLVSSSLWAQPPQQNLPTIVALLFVVGVGVGAVLERMYSLSSTLELANARLRDSEAGYRLLLENLPVGVLSIDAKGRIARVNSKLLSTLGLPSTTVVEGADLNSLPPLSGVGIAHLSRECAERGQPIVHECRWVDENGRQLDLELHLTPIYDGSCSVAGVQVILEDVTERKKAEETIRHIAYHDPLTGLPNRQLFQDRLSQALAQAPRGRSLVAVLMLDLDNFKIINDVLGHTVGDDLLRSVARRLQGLVRAGDTVARMGGDEFMLILSPVSRWEEAAEVAQRIVNAFQQPWTLNGRQYYVTASVGVALYPEHGVSPESLLHNSDSAMYQAKRLSRNTYQIYRQEVGAYSVQYPTPSP